MSKLILSRLHMVMIARLDVLGLGSDFPAWAAVYVTQAVTCVHDGVVAASGHPTQDMLYLMLYSHVFFPLAV